MVTSTLARARPDVVVFYPRSSLARQLAAWSDRHGEYRIEQSFVKDLPSVCKGLRGSPVAVVDVTDDPVPSVAAFRQIAQRLGPSSVLVYTERLHDGLELLVRGCGVLLLWGPLHDVQWDDLLERRLALATPSRSTKARVGMTPCWPLRTTADLEFQRLGEQQFSAGFHWPKTGVK